MPVVLLERIPLPSLRTYTAISVVLLASAVYYAHNTALSEGDVDTDGRSPEASITPSNLSDKTGLVENETMREKYVSTAQTAAHADLSREEYMEKVLYVLVEEAWCVWTLINMAYCCLILVGKLIQKLVFGELRVSEKQHVKDKFWNFVFYKFIFVFGVLNVQEVGEVVGWCAWFSVLCLLHLLTQLSKDRFEYLSFSPTTPVWTHVKVVSLLVLIQGTCLSLLALCVYVGYVHAGINTFAFMAAECLLLIIKTLYVLVRYGIHLWDIHHDGVWENRTAYIYYSELLFELAALSTDFIHHLHMLLWGNILLSMASLVICMQLRYLFHEFQRRIRRHKNYLRVVHSMEAKFPMATREDVEANNDDCAICWERMEAARKLPCGHLFHNACLRSWLEQDTSCPTCRTSLSDLQPPHPAPENPAPLNNPNPPPGIPGVPPLGPRHPLNRMTNHFFHFDGSRYVSWLPSFSVEVSHTQILGPQGVVPQTAQTSQLDNMARQVREVFPHMPTSVIVDDLRLTRSVEVTIENIIEGRLAVPPGFSERDDSESDDSSSGSESQPPSYQADTTSDMTSDPSSMQLPEQSGAAASDLTSMELPATSQAPNRASINFISDSNVPELSGSSDESTDDIRSSEGMAPVSGGRFSKSSSEREQMLAQRKQAMLQSAQRRFMARQTSAEKANTEDEDVFQELPSTSERPPSVAAAGTDPQQRRELVYRAVQRRLNRDQ